MCVEKQEQDLSPNDFLGFFFFLNGALVNVLCNNFIL